MKLKGGLFILMAALCAGCITDGYYYSRDPSIRYFSENEAVVLLGVVGKYDLNVVKGENADGKPYSLIVHPREHSSDIVDVYALPFEPGDSVAIDYIAFEPYRGSNAVSSRFPYVDIEDPKLMHFEKEGIFYYGTVVTSEKGVSLTSEYRSQMIAIAKKKYPSLFQGARIH